MEIRKRLYIVLLFVGVTIFCGSMGYYILLDGSVTFIDCLYMTVITLTTVGYGEVFPIVGNAPVEIFTMLLIIFGMGIILYGISTLTALLTDGELTGILRKRKMERKIKHLKNHYVVCGGGETGFPLAVELIKSREHVVIVENDPVKIKKIGNVKGLLFIEGDATEDDNLISAGIARAGGIMICLPSDNDNLYITMTARMLNAKARIIARMTNKLLKPKLLKAGADSVVSPNAIGAMRMASEMIRPAAVDFLDNMLRSGRGNLRINQILVSDDSKLSGKMIAESGLRDKFNLLILGARLPSGEFEFSPASSFKLEIGMTLIVLGEVDNILRATKTF